MLDLGKALGEDISYHVLGAHIMETDITLLYMLTGKLVDDINVLCPL